MATIINDRDVLLQAASIRFITDNLLLIESKPGYISQYNAILNEQAAVGSQATQYSLTTQKTTYDTAITTLTNYLGTITTPVVWDSLANFTTLSTISGGGAVLRQKFTSVLTAKNAITSAIAALPPPSAGARGSLIRYVSGSVWSDSAANAAVPAPVTIGDTVTISNGTNFVSVKEWTGSAWVAPGTVIDGSLIVTNTVTAAKINSNGLTIRDASGNIILGAGSALDWTKLVASGLTGGSGITNSSITANANGTLTGAGGGGSTLAGLGFTGSTNATYNPGAFANLSGTITAANAATYFATNSIDGTYIANLAANRILAGTLVGGVIYAGAITASQITAGTLTGFIIQTASSGARISINGTTANTLVSHAADNSVQCSIGSAYNAGYIYAKTTSTSDAAILGESSSLYAAVIGKTTNAGGTGVYGIGFSGIGVYGIVAAAGGVAVKGDTTNDSSASIAVKGNTTIGTAIYGVATGAGSAGTFANASGNATYYEGNTYGVYSNGTGGSSTAAYFTCASSKSVSLATPSYALHATSGQGKIYAVDGLGPFTGVHDGVIDIDSSAVIGDILEDNYVFYKTDVSNVLFKVGLSTSIASKKVVGVLADIATIKQNVPATLWEHTTYSRLEDAPVLDTSNNLSPPKPAVVECSLVSGFDLVDLQTNYKVGYINSLGEGQINVCGQNGDIEQGDYIVTSSIAGKGMRQSDDILHSYTVAKARESVSFSTLTEVKMIACFYVSG